MLQTVEQALAAIRSYSAPLSPVRLEPLAAYGMTLAEPVFMEADSPPFDRSLLDGFAVRSGDAKPASRLLIVGRQDAGGTPWQGQIYPGQCLAINTGAILPTGADAVLMVEHSETADNLVTVLKQVPPNFGIQRRAAQAKAGDIALPHGTTLTPAALAAAVSAGAATLSAHPRPRVAILTTGDELAPPGAPLAPGQIRNSNSPMLAALLLDLHIHPLDLGTSGDHPDTLRALLQQGLDNADLLLVTGGMSMGTKDLVPPLLKELGVSFHIEKVLMKPGKPFLFGTLSPQSPPSPTARANVRSNFPPTQTKYVCGLPGNPVSAFVTFHLFVHELLSVLAGTKDPPNRFLTAQVAAPFKSNGDREFYEPCHLYQDGPKLLARPLPWGGSANLFALVPPPKSTTTPPRPALARRIPNAHQLNPGDLVDVLLL